MALAPALRPPAAGMPPPASVPGPSNSEHRTSPRLPPTPLIAFAMRPLVRPHPPARSSPPHPPTTARHWQLGAAAEVLREDVQGSVTMVFASAVSVAGGAIEAATLRAAVASRADMRTPVLIGLSPTRLTESAGGDVFV